MGNIFSCDVDHKKQYDEIIQNINVIKQTLYHFDILHDLKKKKLGTFIMILNDSHQDLSKRQKVLEKIILEINNIYDGFDLQNLRKNIIYVSEQIGLFMSTVDTVKQQKHLLVLKKAEITLSNQITQLIERYVDANKNNLQPLFDQIRDTILDEKSTVFNNIREKFNEMKKRELSHNVNDITKNVDYLSKYFPETVSDQNQFSYDDENYYDKKREEMYKNKKNEYNTYKNRYEYPYLQTDYFDNYKRGQPIYGKDPYSDYSSKYITDPMYSRYGLLSDRIDKRPYPNTTKPNYFPDIERMQKLRNKNVMTKKAPTDFDDLETSFQSTSPQPSVESDDTQILKNKSMYRTPIKNVYKKYSPETKISPLDKSILYTKRDVTPTQYKSSTPISPLEFENRSPYNTPASGKSVRFSPSPRIGRNRSLSSEKTSSTSRDEGIFARNPEKNLLSTGRTKKVDILSPIIDNSQDQVSQLSVGSLKPRQDQKRTLFGKLTPKLGDDDDSVGYVSGSKRRRRRSDSTKLPPFKFRSPSDETTGIYQQQKGIQQQDEQQQNEQQQDEQQQNEQQQDDNESLSDEARKILSSSKKGRELKKTLSVLDDYRESF